MIAMLASYFDYNVQGIINLGVTFISLVLGILILVRDPKSSAHRAFFLCAATGAAWMFFFAMIYLVHDENDAYLWLRLAYLIAIPEMAAATYMFCVRWVGAKDRRRLIPFGFGIAIALGLVMAIFAKSICGFEYYSFGRLNHYRSGPLVKTYFALVTTFFLTYGAMGFLHVFREWRIERAPERKAQMRNVLAAFLIGYTGAMDFFAAFGAKVPHWGYISYLCFITIIAYTIVRHKLLNINLLLKRASLILFIYAVLGALLLPIVIPLINSLLTSESKRPLLSILLLGTSMGAVLSLGPVIYAYLVKNSFWIRNHSATGLAHELKSPLAAIESATEMLLERAGTEGDLTYVKMIQKNTQRLDIFVRDLLNVAQIQESNFNIEKEPLNLSKIILSETQFAGPLAESRHVRLQTAVPDDLLIEGDAEKIRQVLANLLSNAIKFTENEQVMVSATSRSGFAECSVTDKGRGISAQDLPRVFDRFYQGKNAGKGSGVGLSIAKAWVEAHGGRIWVESEGVGQGTTVTFTVPLR